MVIAALALGSLTIGEMAAAHAHLASAAVTVSVEAQAPGGTAKFDYDLYFRTPRSARIDFRRAGRAFIFLCDGKSAVAYEASSNRVVRKPYSGKLTLAENVAAVLGQTDPMMRVYLEPAKGLNAFVRQFGPVSFAPAGRRLTAKLGAHGRVDLEAGSGNLLRSARMDSGDGTSASWTVKPATIGAIAALAFPVPSDARVVASLKNPAARVDFGDVAARAVVARSKGAYTNLRSLRYSSRAFAFTSAGDSTRNASTNWVKGGRLTYSFSQDRPKREFEASYDGKTLTLSAKGRKRRVITAPKKLLNALEAASAPLEPLLISLLRGENFWLRFEAYDAKYSGKGAGSVGGEKCHLIAVAAEEGWSATVYVRDKDGLISRIDRVQGQHTRSGYSESVFYKY